MTVLSPHYVWGLCLTPAKWLVVMLALAISASLFGLNQADHASYFKAATAAAALALIVWAVELISLLPLLCGCCRIRKRFTHIHRRTTEEECVTYPTNIAIPARIRHGFVVVAQLLAIFYAIGAAALFSFGLADQRVVSAALAVVGVTFLGFFLALMVRWLWPCLRSPIAHRGIGGQVKVLQYNINGCVGADGVFDVRRIADTIRASGADIVALQGVGRCCTTTIYGLATGKSRQDVDQLHKLVELTGFYATFCSATRGFGGDYGNAILSRWPVLASARVRLKGWRNHGSNLSDGPMPQVALAVRMKPDRFTRDIWVVSAGFGRDFSGLEQLHEMHDLVQFISGLTSGPLPETDADSAILLPHEVPTNVIVCGDFASERHSPPLSFARMCGLNVVNDVISPFTGLWAPLGTFPSPKWRAFNSPDMILTNSVSDAIKTLSCRVLPSTASTHRPVLAVFGDNQQASNRAIENALRR